MGEPKEVLLLQNVKGPWQRNATLIFFFIFFFSFFFAKRFHSYEERREEEREKGQT